MNKTRKLYNKKLKEINKAHQPEKYNRRKPYNWKKEWGPFIKYDGDWDYAYFLDLIIYKLERMYLALEVYSSEVEESLNKKLKVLKEIIDLGKKIQSYKYEEPSYNFLQDHTKNYVLIYKHSKVETIGKGKFKLECYKDTKLLHKLYLSKSETNLLGAGLTWALTNGYKKKDVNFAYGSEWDSAESRTKWLELSDKATKEKQKDTDKFFKLISKHYESWWY